MGLRDSHTTGKGCFQIQRLEYKKMGEKGRSGRREEGRGEEGKLEGRRKGRAHLL